MSSVWRRGGNILTKLRLALARDMRDFNRSRNSLAARLSGLADFAQQGQFIALIGHVLALVRTSPDAKLLTAPRSRTACTVLLARAGSRSDAAEPIRACLHA